MSSYLRLIQVSSVSQRFFLSRQQLIVVNVLKTFIIKIICFTLRSDSVSVSVSKPSSASLKWLVNLNLLSFVNVNVSVSDSL